MISLTSQYAIKAIMHIAHSNRWCTADHIAASALTPRGYISKVLKTLVETRLIKSQRGINGGFHLIGDAHAITAFDIVHAIDSDARFGITQSTNDVKPTLDESASRLFINIQSDVDHRLRQTSLSDLILT